MGKKLFLKIRAYPKISDNKFKQKYLIQFHDFNRIEEPAL